MIKNKHLYKMDTVVNICSELEGKVFECPVQEQEYETFEKNHLILSARQERGYLQVRYHSEEQPSASENAVSCVPNLEDVFLVVYQENSEGETL